MMIEMALAIDPTSRQEIHDRGMINFLLRRYGKALADLRAYLSLSPADDPQIRDVQTMMHRIRAMHTQGGFAHFGKMLEGVKKSPKTFSSRRH